MNDLNEFQSPRNCIGCAHTPQIDASTQHSSRSRASVGTEFRDPLIGFRRQMRMHPVRDALQAIAHRVCLVLACLALAACSLGPKTYTKTVTEVRADTGATFLARRVAGLGNPGDGRSGVKLVRDGPEALAVRLAMMDRAERSIDAQYYLLHDDPAGHLFAWHMLMAADRGVRVRLLVDDIDTANYDAMTAALDQHPNMEIRLFNPFRRGVGSNIASVFEFQRVNRRMHNKSITADDVVTLIGGRNIGAEYFSAREDSNYDDLDLMGAGPVAKEVSRVFDTYWNSRFAVPAPVVIAERRQTLSLPEARNRLSALAEAARQTSFGNALDHEVRRKIERGGLALDWVPARLVADPPEKAAGLDDSSQFVRSQMLPYLLNASSDLFVASAYFVPRQAGVSLLSGLREKDVRVVILTNSLDSTDVLPVHGHYSRSRKEMLEAGVELWELREDKVRTDRQEIGLGQSQSSLHAKAFAIDRRYLFVGSFNWDPRSTWINNEMGVLVDSPSLAAATVRQFEANLPRNAFRLELDARGDIDWYSLREDGTVLRYDAEPTDSGWRAFKSNVYAIVPFGGLL